MKKRERNEGKALTEQIRKAGYTIEQFCKETGISKTALYSYMSGSKEPTASKLLILSKTLKISLRRVFEMLGMDTMGVPKDD